MARWADDAALEGGHGYRLALLACGISVFMVFGSTVMFTLVCSVSGMSSRIYCIYCTYGTEYVCIVRNSSFVR